MQARTSTICLLAAMLTPSAAAQDGPAGFAPWIPPPEIHEWRAVSELPNRQPFLQVEDMCQTISETTFDNDPDFKDLPHWRKHLFVEDRYKDCMARNGYISVVTPVK